LKELPPGDDGRAYPPLVEGVLLRDVVPEPNDGVRDTPELGRE
jgi:hypothetical protein